LVLQIDHLFAHPEYIRSVAGWIHGEFWHEKGGHTFETLEAALRAASDPDVLPVSLLALVDGAPAGTVNLIHSDSPSRPDLHPWLAALFVLPEHRRRGVGGALCRALVREARRLAIAELFLGTDIPGFYARLGAEPYEKLDSGYIMHFRLGEASPPR
jgi:predicted N-acetyltransferase YhbS